MQYGQIVSNNVLKPHRLYGWSMDYKVVWTMQICSTLVSNKHLNM